MSMGNILEREMNRRDYLRYALGLGSILLAGCNIQPTNLPSPTFSPEEVAAIREQNRLSAQATAVHLRDNPDVLKEEILKIPETLWLNAARVIKMDWRRDKNHIIKGPAEVVKTADSGSCTALEPDLLSFAGHMLHAPGFLPYSVTLDWPQAKDDNIRGVALDKTIQTMRNNKKGVEFQIKSSAHSFDPNNSDIPDIGLVRLETPIPFVSHMSVARYLPADSKLFAILMSIDGNDPLDSKVKPFEISGQNYIPTSLSISAEYTGISDSLFLVAPCPVNRGESGTGVCNSQGEFIGTFSYSGIDSQNKSVAIISAMYPVYRDLINELS